LVTVYSVCRICVAALLITFGNALAYSQTVPSYVPSNGLVAWWPFNGNANDESGNGRNFNVYGATLTSNRYGVANSAYSFDGFDDYLQVNINQNVAFTIAAWVYLNRADKQQGTLQYKYPCIRGGGTAIQNNYGKLGFATISCGECSVNPCNNWSGEQTELSTTGANNWRFIVLTVDGIDTYRMYVDGTLVKTYTKSSLVTTYPDLPFILGKVHDENVAYFDGKIDDAGLWDRALNEVEIKRLYMDCNVAITSHPQDTTSLRCQQVVLKVIAKADTGIRYRWQFNGGSGYADVTDGSLYVGASSPNLTILAASSTTKGTYRCIAFTASCADTSNGAVLQLENTVPRQVPRNGLIGWWPFNCDANDESGNGHHAESKGATLSTDRKDSANKAYVFDGRKDYMIISDSCFDAGWRSYTVSVWTKVDSLSNITQGDGSATTILNTDPHTGFSIATIGNKSFGTIIGDAQKSWSMGSLYSQTSIQIGKWYNVVVVKDSSTVTIYVDGKREKSVTGVGQLMNSAPCQIILGKCSCYLYEFFKGKIDDIGLWDRALSEVEVKRLYGDSCRGGQRTMQLDSMKLGGLAVQRGSTITLTTSGPYQAGSAWLPVKQSVSQGFDLRFKFRLTDGADNGFADGGSPGADGVAFVMQNSAAVATGGNGAGLGYDGLSSSLIVEFDAFLNQLYSDPSTSHIAIQVSDPTRVRPTHVPPYVRGMATTAVPEFRSDGTVYHARIVLQGKRMIIYCDTTGSLTSPLLTVDNLDLKEILKLGADESTFMGFTASTGISYQQHELLEVTLNDCDQLVSVQQDENTTVLEFGGRIIPVPARDEAFIELADVLSHDAVCRITDVRGVEQAELVIPSGQRIWPLPIDELTAGTYIVHVSMEKSLLALPFVIAP
jgi:hypothetical protein